MSHVSVSSFLRRVLMADAALSLAAGAAMALGGVWLQAWVGLPASLLVPAGLGLMAYAGLLVWMSRRASVPRTAVWAVIGINVVWAVDCVAVAAGTWFEPNVLGQAFLGAHVLAGLGFAELQFMGMRRGGASRTGVRQLA